MKPLRLCLLALLLLAAVPAAYAASSFAAYIYPASGAASPAITGVRATFYEPTPVYDGINAGENEVASVWVGISGTGPNFVVGSGCTGSQLLQFGTQISILSDQVTVSHNMWHEEFPCNFITSDGNAINTQSGDSITSELACVSGCASAASPQSWSETWTNNRTGLSHSITRTITSPSAIYLESAYVAIEAINPVLNGTQEPLGINPTLVSKVEIQQAGSSAWVPMPLPPATTRQKSPTEVKSDDGSGHPIYSYYSVSNPVGGNTTSFFFCRSIFHSGSTALDAPCPAAAFKGTSGVGIGP